jgi:hypothetical protein
MLRFAKITLLSLSFFFIPACSMPAAVPAPANTALPPTAIALPTKTPVPAATETLAPTATSVPTATLALTFTPTAIPTYTVLRGEVLERANCRYGPGAPYLYKYGLVPGSNMDVIGRLDDASWVELKAIGGDNPCWVKADFVNVKGDVFSVEPVYPDKAPLPVSPYYGSLTFKEAVRDGDQVTLTWYGQTLRAGDEEYTGAPLYLVEVWACENGEITFAPYGLSFEILTVTDQDGCAETSRARLYFSEKHGYGGPVEVEFP